MTDAQLHQVLFLRKLEEEGTVLSSAQSREATRRSVPPEAIPETLDHEVEGFLTRRTEVLLRQLPSSVANEVDAGGRWKLVAAIALGLSFALGFLLDRLQPNGILNILAPGVFAVILWNLVVYLWTLIQSFRRTGAPLLGKVLAMRGGPVVRNKKSTPTEDAIENAQALAQQSFSTAMRRAQLARGTALVHLCAALVGLGIVAGLLVSGLTQDYRAVYETTWLDEHQVSTFARTVYGTDRDIPKMERTATSGGDGVPAGPWIQRLVLLVSGLVVLPRLLLALVTWLGSRKKRTQGVAKLGLLGYAQRLLRLASSDRQRIAVVPYGRALAAPVKAFLTKAFAERWGGGVELEERPPVPMGEEASYPATGSDFERTVAVFSFGSTPEAEAHGIVPSRLETTSADDPLYLLLDASRFCNQTAELPEFIDKATDRLKVWDHILWGDQHLVLPFAHDRTTSRAFADLLSSTAERGDIDTRLRSLTDT